MGCALPLPAPRGRWGGAQRSREASEVGKGCFNKIVFFCGGLVFIVFFLPQIYAKSMTFRSVRQEKKSTPTQTFRHGGIPAAGCQIIIRQEWGAVMLRWAGFPSAPAVVAWRSSDGRHAGARIVLCGEYASTCRRVLKYSPQSTLAASARRRRAWGRGVRRRAARINAAASARIVPLLLPSESESAGFLANSGSLCLFCRRDLCIFAF